MLTIKFCFQVCRQGNRIDLRHGPASRHVARSHGICGRCSRRAISSPGREPPPVVTSADWPGLEVGNRWDLESRRLRVSKSGQGVVVTYVAPGGPADKKEIKRGDVILEIGDTAIWNVRDYQTLIEKVQDHAKPTLFLVLKRSEGHTWYVAIRENGNSSSVTH